MNRAQRQRALRVIVAVAARIIKIIDYYCNKKTAGTGNGGKDNDRP